MLSDTESRGWITEIEDCIFTILTENPSESVTFEKQDIMQQHFVDKLQILYPNRKDISQKVSSTVSELVDRAPPQIERTKRGQYRLVEGERLFLRVKLAQCEKKLQAIKQILKPGTTSVSTTSV